LYAASNLYDRIGVSRVFKTTYAYGACAGIVGLIVSLALLAVFPFTGSAQDFLLVLAAGLLVGASNLFWFKALAEGEATRLVPFFHVFPLTTILFAAIFLGEPVSGARAAGVLLTVGGALVITLEEKHWRYFHFEKGTALMLCAAVAWSAFEVMQKNLLATVSVWNLRSIVGISMFAVMIAGLASKKARDEFASVFKKPARATIPTVTALLDYAAFLLLSAAVAETLVSAVSGTEIIKLVFLFVFAEIIARAFPKYFKEDLTAKTIAVKITAAALIAAGVYVIVTN